MSAGNTTSTDSPISKIVLLSNNRCYGLRPQAEDEVEQRITLAINGSVSVSRYRYGSTEGRERISTRRRRLQPEQASRVLQRIHQALVLGHLADCATDLGVWQLVVYYRNGEKEEHRGSLYPGSKGRQTRLSNAVREMLGCPDLFVFDGRSRADVLQSLALDYHYMSKIVPAATAGLKTEHVTLDYSERLRIDRARQNITFTRGFSPHFTITSKYHIEDGVSDLLDDLETLDFYQKPDPPGEMYINLRESRVFKLTLSYKSSGRKTISGLYDRDGLPDDWAEFAQMLWSFMRYYGLGEILSPEIYGARRRRKNDLMFVNVVFNEEGSEYCYLCQDETIRAGDKVLVPAGMENRSSTAEVVEVLWLDKEETPIPFEMIKTVIEKISR